MKLYDCFIYNNEDLILDIRFNTLNKYVEKFILVESKFDHQGNKKKLNFNINKFPNFKDKIIYIVSDDEPEGLIFDTNLKDKKELPEHYRHNAIKRISHQRNKLIKGLDLADEEDFILYSDNDEFPNLDNFNFKAFNKKYVIFEQKLFYYKLNLYMDRINWYGTKGCKKKYLESFEKLRQIKPKKYPFYRLDTLLRNDRYMNVNIIKNGANCRTAVL